MVPAQLGQEHPPASWAGDARALETDLRRNVRGDVRFDTGTRALYATDASNHRQVPVGVVVPRDVEDVLAVLDACHRHGAPVLPRGGGTSLAGQCCNVAVVVDTSRHLDRVLDVDPGSRRARVEPGVVLDRLREAAGAHGLTFGPDPATHAQCTLGGMIGNNSCGVHAVTTGRTSDNVESLDVVTHDGQRLQVGATSEDELDVLVRRADRVGEIYRRLRALRDRHADAIRARFPRIPRRVSGFNLDELLPESGFQLARALVGSEGTCAMVLAATVRLVRLPPARALLLLEDSDAPRAADRVPEILQAGPVGLEGLERRIVDAMPPSRLQGAAASLRPADGAWLIVEMAGETPGEARARAEELAARLRRGPSAPSSARVVDDPELMRAAWGIREAGLAASSRAVAGRATWPGWEDSAVAPERLGDYLRELRRLLDDHGLDASFYGHFGEGCVHSRIDFDLETVEGVRRYRAFMQDAADLCVAHGGSLSGEHGDGQARGELLDRMFGGALVSAFREFKRTWDPGGLMNPGKVVDARPLDADLRLAGGAGDDPPTAFALVDDGGSLRTATLRCVGVGLCRRDGGGVMCPSFVATRDERHSTRGRARLLFEMLRGDVVEGGFANADVREALDLCLACKGCKTECPAGVDMATYKAEFLAAHHAVVRRPLRALAFGRADTWLRLGAVAPALANGLARVVTRALGPALGLAPERELPRIARRGFRAWWRSRPRRPGAPGRSRVLLWPDTFTEHLHPEVGRAAVSVLEAAGFDVTLPRAQVCCGRPLYDQGMLDVARRKLLAALDVLQPELEAGTPIVGLEPSCVSVFRDELPGLLPGDERAARLAASTKTLAELVAEHADAVPWRSLDRRALWHVHCHQASVLSCDADRRLLEEVGLSVERPALGCCGMAGAFGFEREKYAISRAIAERELLPAVRAAEDATLLVADGFSCREQVAQLAGRRPLHLAQVLEAALGGNV